MTGRELYEKLHELRCVPNDSELPWHALAFYDKDAWDALAAWLESR